MGSSLLPPDDAEDPGFFPAITHFTNSITALPKEMIRNYTMLKEVDAKIYGPEAELRQFLGEALRKPPPAAPVNGASQGTSHSKTNHSFTDDELRTILTRSLPDTESTEHRVLFQKMRNVMGATLAILDEKNHVMNTTMDALDRQLRRCESSFTHIEDEISEEARYGSLTHWAYTDKAGEKKSILVGERTRRSQNIQDAKEAEGAAIRSDLRREAIKSSKIRNQHLDSDFDDNKLPGKRGQTGAKGRRTADSGYGANGVGLGITNTTAPPNKRRKTEKAAMASIPMERAMSSVYGSTAGGVKGREPPAADSKKKSRIAATSNGNARRRGNTNTSGINSPLASSPIMGTFPAVAAKDRQGRSPAPPMQRLPSARARQNSSQNIMTLARNRSSSMNHKNTNGNNGVSPFSATADLEKVSSLTGRTMGDAKHNIKEAVNTKRELPVEDVGGNDGPADTRGVGAGAGNRTNSDRSTKREEQAEPSNSRSRADRPASISTRGGGGGSKAPSTNPTPHDANFGERARPPRSTAEHPQKRSHKKGAGLAAQLAAQAAQHDDEGSSPAGDDDDEDGENEPRYCYCNGISFGEMVGCDADNCSREWFHLQCVGLTRAPPKTGTCDRFTSMGV